MHLIEYFCFKKIRNTVNLDVSAGLVNGSFGTVTFIESDNNGKTNKVYVKFDSARVNLMKESTASTPNVPKGSIAIERYESAHINYRGDVRRQFPLRLSYAVTIHKVQGLSLDKGVVSLDKIFQAGQAYVALSRVKTLNGLTVTGFNEKAIYCDERIESAINEMPQFLQVEEESSVFDCNIIVLNIQGLESHFDDVKFDRRILKNDFICLTETWLSGKSSTTKFRLDDYIFNSKIRERSYDSSDCFKYLREKQHGGVGLYHKRNKKCEVLNLGVLNIEHIAFYIPDENIYIIVIYRPPAYKLELFMLNLQRLLSQLEESGQQYIIMGDFNQDLLKRTNSIEDCFNKFAYTQCVKDFTTKGGTLLDHVYISKNVNLNNVKVTVVPTYYSYHEAVKITIT